MSDDGCPPCAKVILNGDIAGLNLTHSAAHLEAICQSIERHLDAGHKFPNIEALVIEANALEDFSSKYQERVDKFRRMVLEGIGFNGPWPKSLQ